jgi:hypothetical protein
MSHDEALLKGIVVLSDVVAMGQDKALPRGLSNTEDVFRFCGYC